MHAGATFADHLDARLGKTAAPPRPASWSNRPVTAPLFGFDFALPATTGARLPSAVFASVVTAKSGAMRTEDTAPVREERPAGPAMPTPRQFEAPARARLTLLETRALAALNALGAGLDETVSPDTLRRAFRRLAHRYHPDRHPHSSAVETARLARQFADATAHYRLLAAGLDARLASRERHWSEDRA